MLRCGANPSLHICEAVCGAALSCAHQACHGRCADCTARRKAGHPAGHVDHAHGKTRSCGHVCSGPCFDHVTHGSCPARCDSPCQRACSHGSCSQLRVKHTCSDPCPSCLQTCETPACGLPCAVPCVALPRDTPCGRTLPACGCPCPSLLGESCEKQVCPIHSAGRDQVVDFMATSSPMTRIRCPASSRWPAVTLSPSRPWMVCLDPLLSRTRCCDGLAPDETCPQDSSSSISSTPGTATESGLDSRPPPKQKHGSAVRLAGLSSQARPPPDTAASSNLPS